MIDLKGIGGGAVKIHDPSLRNVRDSVVKAVNSGAIPGLQQGQRLAIARADGALEALSKDQDTNETTVILVDGPTPLSSKRVPASLVLLSVPARGDLRAQKNVDEVVADTVRSLVTPDRHEPHRVCRRLFGLSYAATAA